jgi:hypothetical protein
VHIDLYMVFLYDLEVALYVLLSWAREMGIGG